MMSIKILILTMALYFGTLVCRGAEPVILLSSHIDSSMSKSSLAQRYINAVLRAGGIPLIAPVTDDTTALKSMIAAVQGVVMTGGGDISPSYYNQTPHPKLGKINDTQDRYDAALVRLAMDKGIPILAICRGEQVVNVVAKGTLYQDIPSQIGTKVEHRRGNAKSPNMHPITIDPNSHLSHILDSATSAQVTTAHHQSVKDVGNRLRAVAWSSDGVIEALESLKGEIICVQFHPEIDIDEPQSKMIKLFKYIVDKASQKT